MPVNELTRRLLKWIGYPLFALLMFVVFFYVTFPYHKLSERIEQYAASKMGVELQIEDVGPAPLVGLSMDNVLVVRRPKATPVPEHLRNQEQGGAPAKPKVMRLVLDQVTVKVGLIAALSGTQQVFFDVEGFGGTVEGMYGVNEKRGWEAKLELDGISLKEIPGVKQAVGLPIAGRLTADVRLKVPRHRWSEASGSLSLSCERCTVGDGKTKLKLASSSNALLRMGIKMPRIRLGQFGGEIAIEKGKASLQNLSAKSPDVEVKMEGSFDLRNPVSFSVAQAYLKFKVSPELKKRDAKFELLEGGLQNAKRPDGFFGMRVNGPLRKLQIVPSRLGPPSGGGGGRGGAPRGGPPGRRFRAGG